MTTRNIVIDTQKKAVGKIRWFTVALLSLSFLMTACGKSGFSAADRASASGVSNDAAKIQAYTRVASLAAESGASSGAPANPFPTLSDLAKSCDFGLSDPGQLSVDPGSNNSAPVPPTEAQFTCLKAAMCEATKTTLASLDVSSLNKDDQGIIQDTASVICK